MYFMLSGSGCYPAKALNKIRRGSGKLFSAFLDYPPTKKPCHDEQGFLLPG
jgi:hypothetical protein